MYAAIEIIAVVLVAITMALTLAHAFEYPGEMRLTQEQYFAVQRIYYPGFSYAGFAEPLALVALIVLLAVSPKASPMFWLTLGATVSAFGTHLLYWTLTAPVNKVWLKDEVLSRGARAFFSPDANAARADDYALRRFTNPAPLPRSWMSATGGDVKATVIFGRF